MPPMSEQLGIVRRDNKGLPVHHRSKVFYLFLAVKHEIARVFGGPVEGDLRLVWLLMIGFSGNPVIFYSYVAAVAVSVKVGFYIVIVQVKTNVAVKITIGIIARITFFVTSDLFGRLHLPAERRNYSKAVNRDINAILRHW